MEAREIEGQNRNDLLHCYCWSCPHKISYLLVSPDGQPTRTIEQGQGNLSGFV